jgi:transcriptional regulator with XRE-family HTH domain
MGRPEAPLERDGSPVREFAYWLRDLRNKAGLTYAQLAARSRFSRATLQEALSGRRLPTWQVTSAIVRACGGNVESWHSYWAQIRRAVDRDTPPGLVVSATPSWEVATDTADARHAGEASGGGDDTADTDSHKSVRKLKIRSRQAWLMGGVVLVLAGPLTVALILLTAKGVANQKGNLTQSSKGVKQGGHSRTYTEEEYNKSGAATFRFLNASGPGQPLEFREFVQVSCKVYAPTLVSTKPDGYWYRITSFPWDNNYYAVANTFLNGDPTNGPYTHNTDWKVPNCKPTPKIPK